jgi:hypothetical protein
MLKPLAPCLFVALLACAPAAPTPITLPDAWQRVTGAADPFHAEGDEQTPCEPDSYGPEDFGGEPSFQVRTDGCASLSVSQPALGAARAHHQLGLRLWHEPLSPSDTPPTLAIAVNGAELWRLQLDNYGAAAAAVYEATALSEPLVEGDTLTFHLHNHGRNSYHLFELFTAPPGFLTP